MKNTSHLLEPRDQRVDFRDRVVRGERRPRRRRNPEPRHERLRTVMPCADRDAIRIEDRPDVVRMHPVHHPRHDTRAFRRVPDDTDPVYLTEPLSRVREQRVLVGADMLASLHLDPL